MKVTHFQFLPNTHAMTTTITVGVLALQGAFYEHTKLLRAATLLISNPNNTWDLIEVRTPADLSKCDALIIPGGESTTMSLVACRSGLLEPLRDFVKCIHSSALYDRALLLNIYRVHRKPTWGTCAGLILLAESANRTKKGGQDLIGGLDVRVSRNHFGRQTESFEVNIDLPFLTQAMDGSAEGTRKLFKGIFIRAPVVEKVLPVVRGEQLGEATQENTIVAPCRIPADAVAEKMMDRPVEVMATLPRQRSQSAASSEQVIPDDGAGDTIAVRQGNVFGTSFHPELTQDARIHVWWLQQVEEIVKERRRLEKA